MKFVVINDQRPEDDCLELQDIYPRALKICEHAEATVDSFVALKAQIGDSQYWVSVARKLGKAGAIDAKANCLVAAASNLAAIQVECNTMLPQYRSFLSGAIDTARWRIILAQSPFGAPQQMAVQKNNVLVAENLLKRMSAAYGKVITAGVTDSDELAPMLHNAFVALLELYSSQIRATRVMDYPVKAKLPTLNYRCLAMINQAFGVSAPNWATMVALRDACSQLRDTIEETKQIQDAVAETAHKLNPKQYHTRVLKAKSDPDVQKRLEKLEPVARDLASDLCALNAHESKLVQAYKNVRGALIAVLKEYGDRLVSFIPDAATVVRNNAVVADAMAQEALELLEEISSTMLDPGWIAWRSLDNAFAPSRAPVGG